MVIEQTYRNSLTPLPVWGGTFDNFVLRIIIGCFFLYVRPLLKINLPAISLRKYQLLFTLILDTGIEWDYNINKLK